jgi:hypothetical protein
VTAVLKMTLLICAAGQGARTGGIPVPLVCGKPPGHEPPHRDAVWPVEWDDPEEDQE